MLDESSTVSLPLVKYRSDVHRSTNRSPKEKKEKKEKERKKNVTGHEIAIIEKGWREGKEGGGWREAPITFRGLAADFSVAISSNPVINDADLR